MLFFNKDPLNVVEESLKRRDLKYARLGREALVVGIGGSDGHFLIVITNEESKKTLLFMISPLREAIGTLQAIGAGGIPVMRVHASAGHSPELVARVCEYLLGKNYQLALGSLERDASDGEIRMRVAFPYRDSMPTEEQVGWCLEIGISTTIAAMHELNGLLGARKPMEI